MCCYCASSFHIMLAIDAEGLISSFTCSKMRTMKSYTSLTTALTLYRGGTLGLEQAAAYGGVDTSKLASELRSRGFSVRKEDCDVLAEAAN